MRVLASFFEKHLLVSAERIDDPDENYRLGDFRLPNGLTIECKGQPIDPSKYKNNFIEVFEDTTSGRKQHHLGGFAAVAQALKMTEEELAALKVRVGSIFGKPTKRLGRLTHVSASVHTFVGAAAVAYVNQKSGLVAIYGSADLLSASRQSAINDALCLGAGQSNENTYAVVVPYPPLIWRKEKDAFVFCGQGDARSAQTAIRALLQLPAI